MSIGGDGRMPAGIRTASLGCQCARELLGPIHRRSYRRLNVTMSQLLFLLQSLTTTVRHGTLGTRALMDSSGDHGFIDSSTISSKPTANPHVQARMHDLLWEFEATPNPDDASALAGLPAIARCYVQSSVPRYLRVEASGACPGPGRTVARWSAHAGRSFKRIRKHSMRIHRT